MNPKLQINALRKRLTNVKLLALDFDGIFTDGSVYVSQNGKEGVRCSRRDGLGFEMLRKAGVLACIISREPNSVVSARAKKLQLRCWQSIESGQGKLETLKNHCQQEKISLNEVAYLGDDINDLAIMEVVGLAITVPAAHYLVKKIAHHTTNQEGGNGAIREIIEELLIAKGFELVKLVL